MPLKLLRPLAVSCLLQTLLDIKTVIKLQGQCAISL